MIPHFENCKVINGSNFVKLPYLVSLQTGQNFLNDNRPKKLPT